MATAHKLRTTHIKTKKWQSARMMPASAKSLIGNAFDDGGRHLIRHDVASDTPENTETLDRLAVHRERDVGILISDAYRRRVEKQRLRGD